MVQDRWRNNRHPYTPEEIKDARVGRRPSVERLIGLLDMDDPALPWIANVMSDMTAAGVEVDESSIAIAIKLGRLRYEADAKAATAAAKPSMAPLRLWPEEDGRPSIVYYIRRGKLIKIGTTTNPQKRFQALVPDEILAWEPGGLREERLRHDRFQHLREGHGEYFRAEKDLVAHCKEIRRIHGNPDPTWRTAGAVSARARGRGPKLPRTLPIPTSSAVVTAAQAAQMLGINPNTVAGWVHRKLLKPVDRIGDNKPVYYLDHVRTLRAESRAYRDTA